MRRSGRGPALSRRAGIDLDSGRLAGMVDADVEAAELQEQRGQRLADPVIDRRPAAVDVFPPRDDIVGSVAGDLRRRFSTGESRWLR